MQLHRHQHRGEPAGAWPAPHADLHAEIRAQGPGYIRPDRPAPPKPPRADMSMSVTGRFATEQTRHYQTEHIGGPMAARRFECAPGCGGI